MIDTLITRLNSNPVLWSISLGLIVYVFAFLLAIFAISQLTPTYEISFISAGAMVMGYHWAMSRFMKNSKVGQIIQLSFGLILVSLAMSLVAAATHMRAYEVINKWLF